MPRYIDVHSHLQFSQYDVDRKDVLARMREHDVWTITVGTDCESSRKAVAFAKESDGLYATVGLHPNSAEGEQFDKGVFEEMIRDTNVVAIGECGLDYYRTDPHDERIKKRQREQFEAQVAFSIAHDKPLMLHCRPSRGTMDAYEDVIAIVRGFPHARGNVHFFVGDTSVAKEFLELGFTISFTGVLTFTSDYDDVVRYTPQSSILTETDAPFVAPTPHRGERNEPVYVEETVAAIARIRKEETEDVRAAVVENACRVFHFLS